MARGTFHINAVAVVKAMANCGMGYVALTRKAGVSSATVANVVKGGHVTGETLGKIAGALGVKGETLIRFDGNVAE